MEKKNPNRAQPIDQNHSHGQGKQCPQIPQPPGKFHAIKRITGLYERCFQCHVKNLTCILMLLQLTVFAAAPIKPSYNYLH